jgi:hypothetical protein
LYTLMEYRYVVFYALIIPASLLPPLMVEAIEKKNKVENEYIEIVNYQSHPCDDNLSDSDRILRNLQRRSRIIYESNICIEITYRTKKKIKQELYSIKHKIIADCFDSKKLQIEGSSYTINEVLSSGEVRKTQLYCPSKAQFNLRIDSSY